MGESTKEKPLRSGTCTVTAIARMVMNRVEVNWSRTNQGICRYSPKVRVWTYQTLPLWSSGPATMLQVAGQDNVNNDSAADGR